MLRPLLAAICAASALAPANGQEPAAAPERAAPPNILLIYTDDVGFGDVSCNGSKTIATPNIDRIAREGLRCTDAHSAAATCTPSRYALLTGEYAFRRPGTGVLPGDATLIIEPGRPTLPALLRTAGCRTAVIGKWHLGLGTGNPVDWNGDIKPGPLEVGFDECALVPATGDRVPCVYVKDHRVVGLVADDPIRVSYRERIGDTPTGREAPDTLKMRWDHGHDGTIVNGVSRIGFMTGGEQARWVDEDMADLLTAEAEGFLNRAKRAAKPFFLMFSTHDIHVPRLPHARYTGKSGMGPRGDAMLQLDDCVGILLRTLDRLGLAENTLVIFTSDNGPVLNDGYVDQAVERLGDHKPAGPWRGGKYSNFEAGTRVPFLVRWPARVRPGESAALIGQVDLFASLARLVGATLPDDAAPDSLDQLAALLGEDRIGRDHLVLQAGELSLRQGAFKFIPPSTKPAFAKQTATELGNAPDAQLYDLSADPGERDDLAARQPERAKAMAARLQALRDTGRTRAQAR